MKSSNFYIIVLATFFCPGMAYALIFMNKPTLLGHGFWIQPEAILVMILAPIGLLVILEAIGAKWIRPLWFATIMGTTIWSAILAIGPKILNFDPVLTSIACGILGFFLSYRFALWQLNPS